MRIFLKKFIFRLVDPEGHIAVIIDSAFRSSDHFIDYMSNQINVFLDLHHYQGFGAYWNNLALDVPEAWIQHYKHSCKVNIFYKKGMYSKKSVGLLAGVLYNKWPKIKKLEIFGNCKVRGF